MKPMAKQDPGHTHRAMSSVRNKNSRMERGFESLLHLVGVSGFVRHPDQISGRPDFCFPEAKVAVFLDSCFWHACPTHLRLPTTNTEYWEAKIAKNKARDRRQTEELQAGGWKVVRIWEHELRDRESVLKRLRGEARLALNV